MNSAECGHSAVGRSDQLIGARPSLVPGVRTVTILWTHNGFCSTQDVRILKHLGGVGYLHEDTTYQLETLIMLEVRWRGLSRQCFEHVQQ